MVKQGPCCHCGVTSTPLWRNGPADKPVLCNACGSRWRTKGSLANYTPMHRRDDIDDEEPRASRLRPPTSKPKAQKAKQITKRTTMENGPFSAQNFRRMGDADPCNRSSSGSAVSYSESCVPYGAADASEMTGSAQSHAWESLVPSKKRSCINRPKDSPVEKLAKDLNSIMHEEQFYHLSGSSEDDLLYHSETPVGSVEIGSGSVLLRNMYSKSLEEESEASSVPAENKSYVTSESYSGSASFGVHSGTKEASNLKSAFERPKRSRLQIEDNVRRDALYCENPHILESADSPLVSIDVEDVINYTNFVKYLSKEDQQQLIKLLPPLGDSSTSPESSLRSMFSSIHFADAIHSYQQLLKEGILDPSLSIDEERDAVKRLALTNLTKCKWLECYKQWKEKEIEETGEEKNISGLKGITKPAMKPLKRPHDTHFQSCAELKVTMGPKRIKHGALTPQCKSSSLPKSGYTTKDSACTGGALDLFMLPPEKLSSLIPVKYTDNYSDQDLLLDIPVNARHLESELLYQPSQLSSVTHSSNSIGRVAEGEGHLKQP